MASTYSSLKIQLMATGENSGTWGNVTNTNLGTAIEEAIVGSADVTFASADVTLTLTDTNSTQTARNLRLNLTGTAGASARNLIVPAIEKVYIVNNGLAQTITVKNSTGTGIAVPAGKTMYVYNDGTNVVDAITHLSSLSTGNLSYTGTLTGSTGIMAIGTDQIYKDASGNVGIGTSSPGDRLDVRTASGSTYIRVTRASQSTGEVGLSLYGGTSGVNWSIYQPTSSNNLNFYRGSDLMVLDSSGNLGLGVTPSAWGSSQRAIDIGYSGALKSSTGSGSVVSLTNNAYYTNNWTYKITGQAAALYDLRDTGEHRWYTAPSGTAGNTITFTQAMTLDASGNLGVGTTSPSARLSIGTSSAATTPLNIGFVSEAYSTSNGSQSPYSPAGVALEIYPSTLVNSNAALINFSIPDGSGNYTGAYIGAIANNGVVNGSSPIVFGRRTGISTWAESARITSSGAFLIGATATTGNGNFTNSSGSAVLTASSNSKTYNILYTANASNNATVDAWLGRDIGGGTIASSVLCGNFYVYVTGASGADAYTAVYRIITTGNGTSPASFTLLESVTRGTSPVSSIQIANDGSGGAIKVTVTYINNSGVVTGGSSHISFVGVGI